jgi:hypothetical protein
LPIPTEYLPDPPNFLLRLDANQWRENTPSGNNNCSSASKQLPHQAALKPAQKEKPAE